MGFENFPYTNFHELNLDWIAKIAKDFLEQYTHIQELIANGEQSLQDLTASGLADLQEKADALEQLLQEWYNTHSEDIALQLAKAIADFTQAANAKAAEVIASIPSDYSTLALNALQSKGEINVVNDNVDPPYNDLNTYPVNTIYVGYDSATSALIAHMPGDSQEGRFVVITLCGLVNTPVTRIQLFFSRDNKFYWRKEWGSWGAWHEIADQQQITYIWQDLIPIRTLFENNQIIKAMGKINVVNGAVPAPLNNLNDYPVNTMYIAYDEATSDLVANCPVTQSTGRYMVITLEADPAAPYTRVQLFVSREGYLYFRKEWGNWNSQLSAWHKIAYDNYNQFNKYWRGKSIVWLGTSIPAGGRGPQGTTDNGAYPFKTRQILGDDVEIIDNAVGSSCLWVLKKSLISSTNPYGFDFSYPWERVERCIGLSFAEKQWMIDNRSNWADAPTTLSEADVQRIRNYSYENLVSPYVNTERLWIFDFTNNEDSADEFGKYEQAEPFARYSTKGTLQFLWNMILTNNPKSSIFVLGNYYTDWGLHGRQNEFFETLANTWTLPWFPVWKHVPASPEVPITTKGGWVNGYWNNNAFPNGHTLTMKQIFCPDGLHPHSDLSGKANIMLGRIIGSWINEQAVWFK